MKTQKTVWQLQRELRRMRSSNRALQATVADLQQAWRIAALQGEPQSLEIQELTARLRASA